MGIFSKKSKDTARAMFYDGELQGFTANTPCTFRADITDLITNTIGGMVGYVLYIAFRPITSWVLARLRK